MSVVEWEVWECSLLWWYQGGKGATCDETHLCCCLWRKSCGMAYGVYGTDINVKSLILGKKHALVRYLPGSVVRP